MTKISEVLAPHQKGHRFGNDGILRAIVDRLQREHGPGWGQEMQRYRDAAQKIVTALPYARSIDTYLNSQQNDQNTVFLGKLAITHAILMAERESHLRRGGIDQEKARMALAESWYIPLARILTANHRAENIDTLFDNVSFVVFNYDRCLELFLYRVVLEYFSVDHNTATNALRKATIIHAYGSVGGIFDRDDNTSTVPFGGGDGMDMERIALGIKTYTESADAGTTQRIQDLVHNAETLVFLGFGYLAQNMNLLDHGAGTRAKRIFATAYNTSDQDVAAIQNKMVQKLGGLERFWMGGNEIIGDRKKSFEIIFEIGTCRNLMDNNIFALADQ
jgi:hypothetical protein